MNDYEDRIKMWRKVAMIELAIILLVACLGVAIADNGASRRTSVHVGQIVPNHLKPEKVQEHAGCAVYRTTEGNNVDYWVDCIPFGVTSFSID